MTQKDYQLIYDKVFANYDNMPNWVKDWSLELLTEALQKVKEDKYDRPHGRIDEAA